MNGEWRPNLPPMLIPMCNGSVAVMRLSGNPISPLTRHCWHCLSCTKCLASCSPATAPIHTATAQAALNLNIYMRTATPASTRAEPGLASHHLSLGWNLA